MTYFVTNMAILAICLFCNNLISQLKILGHELEDIFHIVSYIISLTCENKFAS